MRLLSLSILSITGILLLATGCSTGYVSPPSINTPTMNMLVIKNRTRNDINNLEIRVEKLKGIFTCNIILAGSFCSNGFRQRVYENNKITLSWQAQKQQYVIGPIAIDLSKSVKGGNNKLHLPYKAVIELLNDGQFNAYFELPTNAY